LSITKEQARTESLKHTCALFCWNGATTSTSASLLQLEDRLTTTTTTAAEEAITTTTVVHWSSTYFWSDHQL